MDFVKNILNELKNNNYTDKEICKLLCKNPSYLTDWKSGKSKPKVEDVLSIAELLNTSVDFLLGRETNQDLTGTEKKLITDYRSLSEQGKEYILQTMNMAKATYKKSDISSLSKEIAK